MDKRKISIGLAAAMSLSAISVPAYAKVEGDALASIISDYGNYVAEDDVCKATVPGTDKQWLGITEDVSAALINGYNLINNEAAKEESTEDSVNEVSAAAKAAFLEAMRAYAAEKLDTFDLSDEDKETYRKGIEEGTFEGADGARAALIKAYAEAYEKNESILEAKETIADEWTEFIEETDLGHITVPGSEIKYSEVPGIYAAMAQGYTNIWAAKTNDECETAFTEAKENLLNSVKEYVGYLLDTAMDISVGDTAYQIPEQAYTAAKAAIETAESVADVLNAYNTALEAQTTYTYDAQSYADAWSQFIEETGLGNITVPGSEMKYSEVPDIYSAMAQGYTNIWDTKTNREGAKALDSAKENLLNSVKEYVGYLLDTAMDISVGDTAYQIPEQAYTAAKATIETAESVADVLNAYNTALEAQTTYTYDAQSYADAWSQFIEETDLGNITVPGSEMKYSEVPDIYSAMAQGYTNIWDTKTDREGANALDSAKENLLNSVKEYVKYLLDTAKYIVINDIAYTIPDEDYNTAATAIETAESVEDVLNAYDTALKTQTKTVLVTKISVNPTTVSLKVGGKATITATVAPDEATIKTVTWASDNESVATVDANGVVTAIKAGKANITATSDSNNISATCAVTVTSKNSGGSSGGGSSSGGSSSSGGGSSARPTTPATSSSAVGTITGTDESLKASATEAETNKAAENAAKTDTAVNLVSTAGTTVSGKNFTEPAVLKIPVDTKDVKNVNNLTLAKFNSKTGKLEIVGGTYNEKEKAVIGYVTEAGDYFVVEKDNLTTISLQIGNSTVTLNNVVKTLDAAPVISQDRTMIPLRFIAEAFGADIDWIDATKTVIISMDDNVLTMQIGQELEGFGAAPIIINGRTMVPISYISKQFGANVVWVPSTKTVTIAK